MYAITKLMFAIKNKTTTLTIYTEYTLQDWNYVHFPPSPSPRNHLTLNPLIFLHRDVPIFDGPLQSLPNNSKNGRLCDLILTSFAHTSYLQWSKFKQDGNISHTVWLTNNKFVLDPKRVKCTLCTHSNMQTPAIFVMETQNYQHELLRTQKLRT